MTACLFPTASSEISKKNIPLCLGDKQFKQELKDFFGEISRFALKVLYTFRSNLHHFSEVLSLINAAESFLVRPSFMKSLKSDNFSEMINFEIFRNCFVPEFDNHYSRFFDSLCFFQKFKNYIFDDFQKDQLEDGRFLSKEDKNEFLFINHVLRKFYFAFYAF